METILDRDLSGSDVGNHLRDEEGVELRSVLAVCTIVAHLILEGLDTADAYAEDHADAVLVLGLQVHAAVVDSLLGSNHGQLSVAVHLACLLAVQVVVHVEVLHLAGELCLKVCCIEIRNRSSTADTIDEVFPHLVGVVADRRHSTQSCYDDSF